MFKYDEQRKLLQKNLKPIRKVVNLTTQELAEYLCVTKQSISNWENGKNEICGPAFISIRMILELLCRENFSPEQVNCIRCLLNDDTIGDKRYSLTDWMKETVEG